MRTPPSLPSGIYAALWTPVKAEGALLPDALQANLEFLRRHGIHGLLALGSTGQFLHFSLEQRQAIIEQVIQRAAPLSVVVNVTDLCRQTAGRLARFAASRHADGVALMTPYYYAVPQADILSYFLEIGTAAQGLPIWLYNFPERTGNRIELETVDAVAQRLPLAGFKQSGADFEYHRPLVELGRRHNFSVFTGADTRLPEAFSIGVRGCIGGLVNALPDLLLDVYQAAQTGHAPETTPAQARLEEVGRLLEPVPFPLNMAAVMEARGLEIGLPKGPVSPSTEAQYRKLVHGLSECFKNWRLIS